MFQIANTELENMSKLIKLNKLSLKIKKRILCYSAVKLQNYLIIFFIKIDNKIIEQVVSTTFLGVVINQSPTWSDHIKTVKQKVNKSIGILYRVKKNMPLSILRLLYHALIQPYFEYCNIIWSIHRSTALSKLFISQKKAMHIISNSPWNCHTPLIFKKFNTLPLYCINNVQVSCFMYHATHFM